MAGGGGCGASGAVDGGGLEIGFGCRSCWVSGTRMFLKWFFGFRFGGCVDNNVFDVLNALFATCSTRYEVFGVWVVNIFKCFGFAL